MSGWDSCSSCSGGGTAEYSMTQFVNSPSLNGKATQFYLGSATEDFSHALWWKHLDSGSSYSNFQLDMQFYMTNPGASGGVEYNANQSVNGRHYQWSVQCSRISDVWKVWDTAGKKWVSTGIACSQPSAYTWHHVTLQFQRTSGNMAKFISITVDGTQHYVNLSFYPTSTSATSIGIHYQLNGNQYQTPYSVWVNEMNLTAW